MENTDYSAYIGSAYSVAFVVIAIMFLLAVASLKKAQRNLEKLKNEA